MESTSSANEDMPVEKILEAELAVEPRTETYVDANMGLNPNSVSSTPAHTASPGRQGRHCSGAVGPWWVVLHGRPKLSWPALNARTQHVLSGSLWPWAIAQLGLGSPVPAPGVQATGWFHLCPLVGSGLGSEPYG